MEGHAIANFDALAQTPARSAALAIAEAGYRAIETNTVVRKVVSVADEILTVDGTRYDLREYEHLYVLGVGKCAADAADALEELLGERITDGVVLDLKAAKHSTRIRSLVGTHPYPSKDNVAHTAELLSMAERATEHDLILIVVSGGGSTLLAQPRSHSPHEETKLVQHLFKKGARIDEINVIRKHLSMARGGHLARAAHPAQVVGLLFSDVPGNDLKTISSGPTVFDASTIEDARGVMAEHGVDASVFNEEALIETPKDKALFDRVENHLVLTNETALRAMQECAETLGYTAILQETKLHGEAREVGQRIAAALHEAPPRTIHLYGGETTVTISGPGKGGRNEELALGALGEVADDELVLALASDGHDNTDFAGGIADAYTRAVAREHGIAAEDFLFTNDTYTFFHTLQQGVITGYTGANVADLVIAMKHEAA